MKKIVFSLVCLGSIFVSGCLTNIKNNGMVSGEDWYPVTGKISYQNPEANRGEAIPSGSPHRIVSITLDKDSPYAVDLFDMSKVSAQDADFGKILLGCVSGDYKQLEADLIKVTKADEKGLHGFTQEKYITQLPKDLDGERVSLLITKPASSYPLHSDLPDTGRIGSCQAHAKIRNIVVMQ